MRTFSPASPTPATPQGRLGDGIANGVRELGCPNSTDSACTFPACFCHHPMAQPVVSHTRVDELLAEVQRLKLDKGAAVERAEAAEAALAALTGTEAA